MAAAIFEGCALGAVARVLLSRPGGCYVLTRGRCFAHDVDRS